MRPKIIHIPDRRLIRCIRADFALAESFHADSTIDRFRGLPFYLMGLRFTRELRLLDVATDSSGSRPAKSLLSPAGVQPTRH